MKLKRNFLRSFILCLWVLFSAHGQTVEVTQVNKWVQDETGTLSSGEKRFLKEKLSQFEKQKGSQIVVKIVQTTAPLTIEQYALEAAHGVVGRKGVDDGVLLLVAKKDRKLRIEVGYGLEGAIPDIYAKRIVSDLITPKFRAGDFNGGIHNGVDALILAWSNGK